MITPNKLFNLWDMLKQYAVIASWLNSGLQEEENKLFDDAFKNRGLLGFLGSIRPANVSRIDKDRIEQYLAEAERMASDLELDAAHVTTRQIRLNFRNDKYRKDHLAQDLGVLRGRLYDQLTSRQFVHVKPRYVEFHQQKALFGQEVNDCFPIAIDDIQDAGTALALGLGTSCVMHLMRVMEAGLKALAAKLGIDYSVSWEAYLGTIEKNISAKRDKKSVEWKRHEAFYREISGDLLIVKEAWRNPTMHIERRYTQEQAGQVFFAVQALMQRMAQNEKPVVRPALSVVPSGT